MIRHLNLPQLMMLFGGAAFVITVLILGVYIVQKAVRRNLKTDDTKPERVRVEDEAAFAAATVRTVLTGLKAAQKIAQENLILAERRASEYSRKFEVLAREFEHGLIIFDAQGYINFSNPLARKVLAVDTWSRRRYGEIFHDVPALAEIISGCFEAGNEVRNQTIDFQGSDGSHRRVDVTVLPTHDRCGAMEFVACVFREIAPKA